MVFDEDMKDFVDTLRKSLAKFQELKAYAPWTTEDDNKLEQLFCEGKKTTELAKIFGRKEGAITSRIEKLELREKYG